MQEQIDYLDDIGAIESFIKEHYPKEIINVSNKKKDKVINREGISKYWAGKKAIQECSKNIFKDPWDILDKLLNDFELDSIFSKQIINKEHYDNATKVIEEIMEFLKKRRGL